MKDIVKQFKESISKLTPEEFKEIWDEIEAEIGTDYPIFNAKTKCFEYKINNTETIEDSALDYVNSTSITFPEDAVKKAFKAGVEFAQSWVDINNIEVINQNKDDYLEIVSNVVINCTTEKSANVVLTILLKILNGKLIKSSLPTFNLWYYYKENTCYYVNDKSEIMIGDKIEFDKENYIIITGEEFINMYNSQKI